MAGSSVSDDARAVTRIDELRAMFQADIAEGVFGLGGQLAFYVNGHLAVDDAVGIVSPGVPMVSNTLHNVWCASKPLVAMAVLLAAERGDLDLDAPISEQFADHEALGLVASSPRQVLSHASRSIEPRAFAAAFAMPQDRLNAAVTSSRSEWGYSEYAGWRIMDEVLSQLRASSASRVVMADVVVPMGMEDDVRMDLTLTDLVRLDGRIGAVYPHLPASRLFSRHDATIYLARTDRAVTGAYMTARALGSFYARLLAVLRGEPTPGLPSPTMLRDALGRPRGGGYDTVLERECDFAAGFMVNLPEHGMAADLPPEAFGHSGLTGSIFGLANPRSGCALAVVLNGANISVDDARLLYRRYTRFCV